MVSYHVWAMAVAFLAGQRHRRAPKKEGALGKRKEIAGEEERKGKGRR